MRSARSPASRRRPRAPWQAPELANGSVPELDSGGATTGAPDAAVVEADNAVREAIAAAQNAAVSIRGQHPDNAGGHASARAVPSQETPAPEPPQR